MSRVFNCNMERKSCDIKSIKCEKCKKAALVVPIQLRVKYTNFIFALIFVDFQFFIVNLYNATQQNDTCLALETGV